MDIPEDLLMPTIIGRAAAILLIVSFIPTVWRLLRKTFYYGRRFYWAAKRFFKKKLREAKRKSGSNSDAQFRKGVRRITRKQLRELSRGVSVQPFRPWRKDFTKAFVLWAVVLGWMVFVLFWLGDEAGYVIASVAIFCVVPFYFGFSYFERGQKRRHGKKLEVKAIRLFEKLKPATWDVMPNHTLDKCGDIDLLVRVHTDELCAVEIKSWHRWNGYLRIKRALMQVRRQRRSVGASYGVIWLPHARTASAKFRGGIFVVGGNTRYLLKKMSGILNNFTVVQFPSKPSPIVLNYIKSKKFRWNRTAIHWEGMCREDDMFDLRNRVEAAGGFVSSENSPSEPEEEDQRRFA